jgi:hypothetical protein
MSQEPVDPEAARRKNLAAAGFMIAAGLVITTLGALKVLPGPPVMHTLIMLVGISDIAIGAFFLFRARNS